MSTAYQKDLRALTLKLTNNCNLSCVMCGQAHAQETAAASLSEEPLYKKNGYLPLPIIRQCLEEAGSPEHVYLFGGEPFLYPELPELLSLLRERGIAVRTTTNGTILKQNIANIFDYGIRDIDISIDSHIKESYEKIRGKNVFDIVANNLQYLIQERERRNSKAPTIGISCVILPETIPMLLDYYHYFTKNYPGLDRIIFEVPMITTRQQGLAHHKICHEALDCEATSWEWFCEKIPAFTSDEINMLHQQLEQLKQFDKVLIQGPSDPQGLYDALGPDYVQPKHLCEYPFNSLAVMPNGDMLFCVDYPDYVIGNLYRESFREAWHGSRAENFRNYLLQHGNFPICARCCHRNDRFSPVL